jgi:competence protein ComEC
MRWLFFVAVVAAFFGARGCDRFGSENLRVTFFDVGQGDAALVRFPGGTAWLIDAGGGWKQWDRGQRELFLELARMGILTLDAAVLSHPDTDHGLGFRGLFGQVGVREFWYNAAFSPVKDPLLAELLVLASRHGTLRKPVSRAFRAQHGLARALVHPLSSGPSTNERPLVVRLDFAECSFLFAGDAERAAEASLARRSAPVTVLKVNHHGSRTSSSPGLVKSLRPRWAVASLGARNIYRHPAPQTARRFGQVRARWLRTDVHGFVEFTVTPGGNIACQSAAGACGEEKCVNRLRSKVF